MLFAKKNECRLADKTREVPKSKENKNPITNPTP